MKKYLLSTRMILGVFLVPVFILILYILFSEVTAFAITPALIFTGITLGVILSYLLFHHFEGESTPLNLAPGEKIKKDSREAGQFVTFVAPREIMGFTPDQPPRQVDLILTNLRLIALIPGTQIPVVEVPLNLINYVNLEQRFRTKFLRVNYVVGPNEVSEFLLFPSEGAKKWFKRIQRQLAKYQQPFREI